jgi:hypothetical protein
VLRQRARALPEDARGLNHARTQYRPRARVQISALLEDRQHAISDRPAIREEYENGREYYRLHGKRLEVVPDRVAERPSPAALAWHAEHVFR